MLNIFVTNLGKYNEGDLVGEWVELPCSDDDLRAALERIGINEQYEEYFITDYETDFSGLVIGEYENIYALNEKSELIDDLNEWDREKLAALLEYDSAYFPDIEDAINKLDDIYLYPDVHNDEDLGYYIVEEGLFGFDIPDGLQNYIDYEAIGRDWKINASGGFTNYGFLEMR